MQDRSRKELYFNDGKKLGHWGLLDLANCDDKSFVDALYEEGRKRGLTIEFPVVKKCQNDRNPDKDFVALYDQLALKGKPDLIMVLVRSKDSHIYSTIKLLGDTIYKIPTQVLFRSVFLKVLELRG